MITKEMLEAEAEIAAAEVVEWRAPVNVKIYQAWAYSILTKAETPAAQVGSAVLALPKRVWTNRQSAIWAAEEEWEAIVAAGIRPGASTKLRWKHHWLDSGAQFAEPTEWVYVTVYPVAVIDERRN